MDRIKDDNYYIQRIKNDLQFIVDNMKDVSVVDLKKNEILLDSMMFRMIQVSENAKKLSDEYIINNQDIPWTALFGLRNRIVHDYGNVILDIVFETLNQDIPDMLALLK